MGRPGYRVLIGSEKLFTVRYLLVLSDRLSIIDDCRSRPNNQPMDSRYNPTRDIDNSIGDLYSQCCDYNSEPTVVIFIIREKVKFFNRFVIHIIYRLSIS